MTIETTTETETPTTPFIVSVEIDQYGDADSPSEYGLFELVSFSNRHNSYRDPDTLLACSFEVEETDEDGYEDSYPCEEMEPAHETLPHDYQTDETIAFKLSYFEHGLCRWSLTGEGSSDPWDSVPFAGVLLVREEFLSDWETMSPEDRVEAARSFCDEYTAWANGWIYNISVTRPEGDCPCCNRAYDPEILASCGGFIFSMSEEGDAYRKDAIEEQVREGYYAVDLELPDELTEDVHYTVAEDRY